MARCDRPNILLVTTDSQRCDTIQCMGNPYAISPNLDNLAAEGVMFTQAHSSSPVCMPTRCSLLTGLHTPLHGCIENGIKRRTDIPLFPDSLKEQGYHNIMVGKTHFGPVPDSFDVQLLIKGEKDNDSDDCYADHIRKHGYSRKSAHPNPIPEKLFIDSYLIDKTIEAIEGAGNNKSIPFFAFCSLLSPHGPLDPPGKWGNIYDEGLLPDINYREGELVTHPLHLRRLIGTLDHANYQSDESGVLGYLDVARGATIERYSLEEINQFRRLYYGLASYCDAQIGRLIHYLDRSGLRENTLVIFASDHGQQLFDHGFNDKHNYYDASWRIPLIMSMPGTLPGGEKRDFAIWNDLTATILGAAGTESCSVQGFDLFNALKDGKDSPRRCAVGTLYQSAALATGRWKLEYYFEEGSGRLFDRKKDPLEQTDSFANPEYREVRDELLKALLTWRADLCDIDYLRNNTGGGGPVAIRAARHTMSLRGTDAENRLNRTIEVIDSQYDYF
jgi:arylsulfatase A-like enzyme